MLSPRKMLGGSTVPITKESLFETLHIDQEGIDRVIEKTKNLIHEGNVRRLLVKNAEGVTLIEVPLTVGVVGAVLVPVWAAIAAIATMVVDATVIVEKRDEDGAGETA
jgi:ribonuclease PH